MSTDMAGNRDAAVRLALSALDPAQWDRLRLWVEAETGMDFSGTRLVRLRDAVQRTFGRSNADFNLDSLLAAPERHGPFFERLNAELTVGESFFFRNEHHFRALREHVIPAVMQANRDSRSIRVWSAGCATGEEPHSLAILFDQELAGREDWNASILATDLNPEFLQRAREAVYRPWSFRQTNVHQDRRYFTPEEDTFRVVPRIRERVRFMFLNLVKDVYPSSMTGTLGLDLIVFRNVAIYLKVEVTRAILERFHRALRPGGWLLLGETEISMARMEGFESRLVGGATFLRKISQGAAPTEETPPPILPVILGGPGGAPILPQRPPPLPTWSPLPGREPNDRPTEKSATPEAEVEQLLRERRFDEAERAVERLAIRSDRARLRLRCCRAFVTAADKDKMRRMLRACLADEPLLLEAHLLEASLAEETGDLAAAETAYRRALYLDRNCPMAHFHLALVQQQKGDNASAERSLRTTVQLTDGKPPESPVEFGEGMCYGRLREMALLLLGE